MSFIKLNALLRPQHSNLIKRSDKTDLFLEYLLNINSMIFSVNI